MKAVNSKVITRTVLMTLIEMAEPYREGDEMKLKSFVLEVPGALTEEKAKKLALKNNAIYLGSSNLRQVYQMPLETFIANAELIEGLRRNETWNKTN